MRTPRRELPQSTLFEKQGHYLSKKMHDEDNENGLIVTSKVAQKEGHPSWIAYGDKMLHHTKNSANFKFAQRAVQLGVDEVFQASQKGAPEIRISESKVFDFIPYLDPKDKNNTPMFQVRSQDGKVVRRRNLKDLQCGHPPIDNWNTFCTGVSIDQGKPKKRINQPSDKEKLE